LLPLGSFRLCGAGIALAGAATSVYSGVAFSFFQPKLMQADDRRKCSGARDGEMRLSWNHLCKICEQCNVSN
jgi:hypothetical protein